MKPATVGILVGPAVIAAFMVGHTFESESEGPLEKVGEKIDQELQSATDG